jgi:curli biogenesis system outer membrane secretion channel CsgG
VEKGNIVFKRFNSENSQLRKNSNNYRRFGMLKTLLLIVFMLTLGCSTYQEVVVPDEEVIIKTELAQTKEQAKVLKRKVAIARFTNESKYAKGYFYDKDNDPLGKQVVDILSTKLTMSNKFILLEREDINLILKETQIGDVDFQNIGADYIIVGSLTEFGRRNIGDVNLLSRTKSQIVYAAVNIRLIDVSTGQIIYSEEGKGEAETSTTTFLGLGETADYDASLSDKAISVAISQLVENIIQNCMDRPWKSYILAKQDNNYIISGGKSQGLIVGDKFDVIRKGSKVKNPQTGMFIELPGEIVGEIQVSYLGGDTPENEYSIGKLNYGKIDNDFEQYYIGEKNE